MRILYLSDYRMAVYHAQNKNLAAVHYFLNNEEGLTEFAEYLQTDSTTHTIAIIDSIHEEYQVISLPHVSGRDRQNLFAHRMKRLFEQAAYTHSEVQEREPQGRKDDKVLFTSIAKTNSFSAWLQLIPHNKIPLIAIYSLPLLSQKLLTHLLKSRGNQSDRNDYLLLVSHTGQINSHSIQGLRQFFFVRKKLQFSRLTPLNMLIPGIETFSILHPLSTKQGVEYIVSQIIKTQNYLVSTRLLARAQNLSVIVLTYPGLIDNFNSLFQQYPALNSRYALINIEEVARNLCKPDKTVTGKQDRKKNNGLFLFNELKPSLTCIHHLIICELLHKLPKNHYAKFVERRYFWYQRVRLLTYVSTLAITLATLAFSGTLLYETERIEQQGLSTERELNNQKNLLKSLQNTIPTLRIKANHLRTVVDVGRLVSARDISPQPLWRQVSGVLVNYPLLSIQRLEWGTGSSSSDIFKQQTQPEEPSMDEGDMEPPSAAQLFPNLARPKLLGEEEPANNTVFTEGLRIRGDIEPFDGDYRKALLMYNDFVDALQQEGKEQWTINKLQPPYKKVLIGQIGQEEKEKKVPFQVEILIKHDYAQE